MTVESRDVDTAFAEWAKGYGRIRHTAQTRTRIRALAHRLLTGEEQAALDHHRSPEGLIVAPARGHA